MSTETETTRLLRQAYEQLGQTHLRWKSGQTASATLRDLEEAKRLMGLAEDRLMAHCAD